MFCNLNTNIPNTRSTGIPQLDNALPGEGWPCAGLVDIVPGKFFEGIMPFLIPLMSEETYLNNKLILFDPPYIPYHESISNKGVNFSNIIIVKPNKSTKNRRNIIYDLFKQGLNLDDCNVVIMWTNKLPFQVSRQFNLIAQLNSTLAIIIRTDKQFYQETTASILKIKIELIAKNIRQQKAKLEILKSTIGFTKKYHVILI